MDMESEGVLNIASDADLCALQYVYAPRIQSHLDRFVTALINRPLRTEHCKTPLQLRISGQLLDPKMPLETEVHLLVYLLAYSLSNTFKTWKYMFLIYLFN